MLTGGDGSPDHTLAGTCCRSGEASRSVADEIHSKCKRLLHTDHDVAFPLLLQVTSARIYRREDLTHNPEKRLDISEGLLPGSERRDALSAHAPGSSYVPGPVLRKPAPHT